MSAATWVQTLIAAQVAGPLLSDSTVATSILPAASKYTLPANTLNVGSVLRLSGSGQLSNVVTTPGTLTLDVRFTSTGGGTIVVFNGGALNLSITAHTNQPIWFEILLTARVIGAAANFMGQGYAVGLPFVRVAGTADSNATANVLTMPATAPAVGNNFDSTANEQIDMFATFSVNTDPTNLTLQQFLVENLTF